MTTDLEHRLDVLSAPQQSPPPPGEYLDRVATSRRRARRRAIGGVAGIAMIAGAGLTVWIAARPSPGPTEPVDRQVASEDATPAGRELAYTLAASLVNLEPLHTPTLGLSSGARILRMIDGADPDVLDRMLREW
ncbi:MAG: hypothetical protein H6811_02455 [Phycisphaeraceae bacterium]|nr:hypothetical protein [Phycisphaeraceae bacterium]